MSSYYVGVDIGGTFTDIVAVDVETGQLTVLKTPSTPPTFVEGILKGLSELPFGLAEIELFIHGSTIATNGIIERKGARTALLTTRGFRDVLLCARSTRPDVYDLRWKPAEPLVKRRNVFEVTERMNYRGQVVAPLDEEGLRGLEPSLRKRGIESIAVSFLNSFMNPEHESRAKQILQEMLPGVHVSTSYEVYPEIREFERTSTVVANAYLAPLVDRYLARLLEGMRSRGFLSDVLVVHSGGGVMTEAMARRIPARICNSGPAGGVMGGAYIGMLAGFDNVVTMDIGGTSTDVALIKDGRPIVRTGLSIEHNIPVAFPTVDVTTVGAGGGSIGWVDQGGILRNGPESAGANPGPACYGQGGTKPTNTDAKLVLGRLSSQGLLGGRVGLDVDGAREAIKPVAEHFGWSLEETAEAMLTVANANIVNAIRLISIQRGHDLRDFTLVAFGGAGPMYGVEVARELGMPHVVVPQSPGLASAFGMLHVDIRHDLIKPLFRRESELSAKELNDVVSELEAEAARLMSEEGLSADSITVDRHFDMKYFPQSSYMSLDGPPGELTEEGLRGLVDSFNQRHQDEYGYQVPRHAAEVEIGHVRVTVTGVVNRPALKPLQNSQPGASASVGKRPVHFPDDGWVDAAIHQRDGLRVGDRVEGPAVIEQFDTTTVMPSDSSAVVDIYGNLIISFDKVKGGS